MSDTDQNVEPPAKRKNRVSFGGGREALVLLVLLVLLSRVGPQLQPLLFLITVGLAVHWYVRICFRFGKAVGIGGVAFLFVGCVSIALFQYNCHLKNEALSKKLGAYETVTIQRHTVFPSSEIYQVSLKDEITDDDLTVIASIPELDNVTDVYIKNCNVTDKSLDTVGRWPSLTYIFIESDIITDGAIMQFERRHPNCTVIPYGRNK